MVKYKIRRLPVVNDKNNNNNNNNTLVGIVTVTDIIKGYHEKNKDDNSLPSDITPSTPSLYANELNELKWKR